MQQEQAARRAECACLHPRGCCRHSSRKSVKSSGKLGEHCPLWMGCVLRAATLCAMCALCPLWGTVCCVYWTDAAAHRADAAARAECVEEDHKARKQIVIEQHLERLTQVKAQATQVSIITSCIACKHLSDVELPSFGCCWPMSVGCCLLSDGCRPLFVICGLQFAV